MKQWYPLTRRRFCGGTRPKRSTKLRPAFSDERSRGKLIMACGTGKTLTSLRAAERLAGEGGRVLYLVPSLALMSQTVQAWAKDAEVRLRTYAVCSDSQVGKRKRTQDDSIDMDILDLAWPATTDATKLAEKASGGEADAMTVVFATYQSSPVLEAAQKEHGLPGFDLVICDEAHRTAGAIIKSEEPSNFTRIHKDDRILASRRLYMTATPKVYAESARNRAGDLAAALCSMDDEELYGPVLYELGFAEAVEKDLLADYRVIVLTVSEDVAAQVLAQYATDPDDGLKLDDAALMIGCWRALAKADPEAFPQKEREPMRRAIAFCRTIKASEQLELKLGDLARKYRALDLQENAGNPLPDHDAPAKHVDGTFNASQREEVLSWLDSPGDGECRILTNARCLTEGVDLPALDGILFMHPRKSQIEVVQAVGRVMRKAKGKRMGYIVLPVVVAPGASASALLDDNERWRKVWQMLNAIRSHDEGFDAELNRIEMGESPKHLSIIALSGWTPPAAACNGPNIGSGQAADRDDYGDGMLHRSIPEQASLFEDLPGAIMAKIVEKCGSRMYWDEWAGDVALIARAHIERITALVTPGVSANDDPDAQVRAELFDEFVRELQDDLNPGVTREDAIEMLAQHLVTGPVFDALFGEERFTTRNPVSQAMSTVLEVIKPSGIQAEAEALDDFYDSVRRRVQGAGTDEAKQKIVAELYDKFFRNAFKATSKKLGIVYTRVEVVDFILHSVANVLEQEFGTGLGDEGVHILDPFVGTGTFLTRLLQSGLIGKADLERKYGSELHANEIVLLAYYIASVNIEAAYHGIVGGDYRPFERVCLTDTFQMSESDDFMAALLEDNSSRRKEQKSQDIKVIFGNPPWEAGKKEPGYPLLYERIESTYARRSTATNKTSLYDSYKLAIRWASDRVGKKGVVGLVTNGSWIDGNVDAGIRACLAEEFTSVHVLNLRGNARTSGELRRSEGGNVFEEGTRAPAAITILAKNPDAAHRDCRILYHDIGDYLTSKAKLSMLSGWGSVNGIDNWQEVAPDEHHGWINRREDGFLQMVPLGSKAAKSGRGDDTIFRLYSNGYKTGRDAYLYNFSRNTCLASARRMIEDYHAALAELGENPTAEDAAGAAARHSKHTHWDRETTNNLKRRKDLEFASEKLSTTAYRPFVKQHCYVEYLLVSNKYQQDSIFPSFATQKNLKPDVLVSPPPPPHDGRNKAICVPGIGATKQLTVLMVNTMPDLNMMEAGTQCFPRWRYATAASASRESGQQNLFRSSLPTGCPTYTSSNSANASPGGASAVAGGAFDEAGLPFDSGIDPDGEGEWIDNITDAAWGRFQAHYGNESITKDDIFDYVYGVLHAPDFRQAFPNALAKELARIPLAHDFRAFAAAGRALGDLHVSYETCPEFPLGLEHSCEGPLPPELHRLGRKPMRFAGNRGATDMSVLIVNDHVRLTGIPDEAHDYVVNGRTPLEWLIDRYKITEDTKSGILNDANAWFEKPEDLLSAIRRIVHLSVETARIVRNLPPSL